MNAIVKFLIYSALIAGVLALLNLIPLVFFGAQVLELTNWLFNALIPFRGIINLPAFSLFLVELMAFEIGYWTYVLLDKVFAIYAGSSLRQAGKMDAYDSHMDADRRAGKLDWRGRRKY